MKEYIEREAAMEAIKNHKCESKIVYSIEEAVYCVGQEIGKAIRSVPAADPIREMGGCYCWECEEEDKGHCRKLRGIPTIQIGFCGYGRRREDA